MRDFDLIMKYEEEGLDQDELIELFQALVDNGQAWQLQGSYGRVAMDLLEAGEVAWPVQVRRNSEDDVWDGVPFADPYDVPRANRVTGWCKYRIRPGVREAVS